jgi:cytoskeletal protein CcmA (bactofilin family)
MKANSLSPKSTGAKYSQSRTDSLIGAGVRVEGNILFTGVLRIEGDLLGNVSCDADSNGTIVVGESGIVTGTIKTPHIVVGGQIHGPVHSWESIEIHQGARVAGDAFYRGIDIHPGGVIEGSLTPDGGMVEERDRLRINELPARMEYDSSLTQSESAGSGFMERFGGARKIGGVVALLIVATVAAAVLMNHDPTPTIPPALPAAADGALKADTSAKETPAEHSAPAASGGVQDGPKTVAGSTVPPAPPAGDVGGTVQASPPAELSETDPGKVALVQGVNPGKPAGVLLVIGKEPAVLFRKKRQDAADGTRIEISRGATESIPFAKNEVFRVASGRDLQIFYQGRKVAPKIIESGAWLSFVPHSSTGSGDRK